MMPRNKRSTSWIDVFPNFEDRFRGLGGVRRPKIGLAMWRKENKTKKLMAHGMLREHAMRACFQKKPRNRQKFRQRCLVLCGGVSPFCVFYCLACQTRKKSSKFISSLTDHVFDVVKA